MYTFDDILQEILRDDRVKDIPIIFIVITLEVIDDILYSRDKYASKEK